MAKPKASISKYSTALLLRNLPFILFCAFLASVHIANRHYSERKIRELQSLQKQLKTERWNYMAVKSQLMYDTKQGQVSKRAKALGLQELKQPPKKILIKK